jgi:hypothetical protein
MHLSPFLYRAVAELDTTCLEKQRASSALQKLVHNTTQMMRNFMESVEYVICIGVCVCVCVYVCVYLFVCVCVLCLCLCITL